MEDVPKDPKTAELPKLLLVRITSARGGMS